MSVNVLCLKHFNFVVVNKNYRVRNEYEFLRNVGVLVAPNAVYALPSIEAHYSNRMNDSKLSKSFYESWNQISNLSPLDRIIDQLVHYWSTYGSGFVGEAYIPNAQFGVDNGGSLAVVYVSAKTNQEVFTHCMSMLGSNMALSSELVKDLISIIRDIGMIDKVDVDSVKNREAKIILMADYGCVSTNAEDVLRVAVYMVTGDAMIIKNEKMISAIKYSSVVDRAKAVRLFNRAGLENMATIFNRFKPIFLAFKYGNVGDIRSVINKISKLSKTVHVPMNQSLLSVATSVRIQGKVMGHMNALKNASIYQLVSVYNALAVRLHDSSGFVYRIRNGRKWVDVEAKSYNTNLLYSNLNCIRAELASRMNNKFAGKKFYVPSAIEYAVPTSGKAMLADRIPEYTVIKADNLAVGVYWHNDWGVRDLDLSGLLASGDKVGWNGGYNMNGVTYSGDITNAPDGATEYLMFSGSITPTLVYANQFWGYGNEFKYRIVVGNLKSKNDNYMMNSSNLVFDVEEKSDAEQVSLGLAFNGINGEKCFAITKANGGGGNVSRFTEYTGVEFAARVAQIQSRLKFKELIVLGGGEFVDNAVDADVNLAPEHLTAKTFLDIMEAK